ncbi:MAG: hypothetical protein LBS57_08640 [Treponema sp.]|jgi:phage anti-repressor protein|nr:hypothetical protein [Treponema sp.]
MNELVELKERFEAIAQSTEEFPVDFDDAWVWIGYARKDSALRTLQANFDQGIDFNLHKDVEVKEGLDFDSTGLWNQKTGRGGDRRTVKYFLAKDCFKSFCMMAGTEKGKEVRKYYIQIEKAWNTPEAVAARARQMGISLQPEPPPAVEKPWSYYPFFDGSTFAERTEFMKWLFANELVSREELPGKVFYQGLPVHEVYLKFKEVTGINISRNVFVRQLKEVDSRIVNKQKKINGVPLLAFFGIEFKENSQS